MSETGFHRQIYQTALLSFPEATELLAIPLQVFACIPSTNQILWELMAAGQGLPLAAIALQQTAGRGQWGRQWQSELGGIYLSLALNTDLKGENAVHLTLASAWGVASLLREFQIPVQLKWPNDLILQGRKLGGIKSETRVQSGKIQQLVLGIGLNWRNPTPPTGIQLYPFVAQHQLPLTNAETLSAIALAGLWRGYQSYQGAGIEGILPGYLTLFANQGQKIEVEGRPGVVVGVTPQGELRVRLAAPGATTEICLPPGAIALGYSSL